LIQHIEHVFSDPALLEQALTHRSHSALNNERLEFLGDAVLGVVISQILYNRFPAASEGDLTRLRAELVNGQSLASVARDLGLGHHLRLGKGELNSGGQRKDSMLANGVEAVVGAICVDGGLDACRRCISRWFADRLDQLELTADYKDAKTRLQEYAQARGLDLPRYRIEQIGGEEHARRYNVSCSLALTSEVFFGSAASRRKAEQVAALKALTYLDVRDE
jgi:ribonuclease-3